jgi:antitoxin component of MazEF toxin-antitoxin module
MTVIELSDEQAAALKEKAAAQGLSLEAWLKKLAAADKPVRKVRYSLSELVAHCDPNAPLSVEDRAWLDDPAVGREVI